MEESETIKSDFRNKHILSLTQFDVPSIQLLFSKVPQMAEIVSHSKASNILTGNLATLLFYEPSSRTLGSFAAAVKRLGGQTLEFPSPKDTSSTTKGETLEDTINVMEQYSDVIVLRHPQVGTATSAAKASHHTPIINAGDGKGEHPTQTLLDLYTIQDRIGRLSDLTILIAGDIKNGRTVHSLLKGLSLFPNNTVYLLSHHSLRLEKADFSYLEEKGLKIIEIKHEEDIPQDADVWYWTRVQKERFESREEYEKVKDTFTVTQELLKTYASKHMILMHPLPRVGEIEADVDSDSRSVYLTDQTRNGLYIRMALIALVLGKIE